MRFVVHHCTRFTYSQPVFVDPLTVRLRPREDHSQRLHRYSLSFDPTPVGATYDRDLEGNVVANVWFGGLTQLLSINSVFEVETHRDNPYELLLRSDAMRLPLNPCDTERSFWPVYATPRTCGGPLATIVEQLLLEVEHGSLAFCARLAAWIQQTHSTVVREKGEPWPAEETLQRREGSCRDLAMLFVEACRLAGIPGRFVSGYSLDEIEPSPRYLHAWGEAYLPGAGWRGFDPSQGLAVAESHVALAAARTPQGAAPTEGTFRSPTARSAMDVQIVARVEHESPSANQVDGAQSMIQLANW